MVNGWKVTAIIFIIIATLELMLISWAWTSGVESIEKENECSINICADYSVYYFDTYEDVCYCYENDEIVHQEYIKNG